MISLNNLKYLGAHVNTDDNSTHEYVNIEIVNEYSNSNTLAQPMIFDQVKTSNIVDVTSDYFLSIVRWNIQSNLPVLIPDMASPAQTKYQIGIAYTSGNGTAVINILPTEYIIFKPEDYTQSPLQLNPAPRALVLNDPYYYLKSVNSFLFLVNKTLIEVINAYTTWAIKPFFEYDPVAGKIVLNMPATGPSAVTPPVDPSWPPWAGTDYAVYIVMNQSLYNLFNTFQFITLAGALLNDPSSSK